MPYPAPHLKVVASGRIYGSDIWSCGLNIAQNFDGPLTQPTDLAPYLAAWSTWLGALNTGISQYATLDLVKVNLVGTDGLHVDQGQSYFIEAPPTTKGSSASTPLPQQTLVVTLGTSKQRGLASKGRIFPPLVTFALNSDGKVSTTDCRNIAGTTATLVSDLNAIGPGDVAVLSNVGAGASNIVRSVSVGNVYDTQRRRRNAFVETYTASVTPPTVATP